MPHVNVLLVEPPQYTHAAAFVDVADALCHGLRDLGHHSDVVTRPSGHEDLTIVVGANLLAERQDLLADLPANSLLYNLEQIEPGSPWCTDAMLDVLRMRPVLDYSGQNLDRLTAEGVDTVGILEVGHHPVLERIEPLPAAHKDIDVLFYGSLNERRAHVLHDLAAHGVAVHHAFGVYGSPRDELIARSHIVLNMHHFEAKVFEIVRVSYLLANGCFVVSETGGDPALEEPFRTGVAFADRDELVDTCIAFLANPAARESMAATGREIMRSRSQADHLAHMLERLPVGVG